MREEETETESRCFSTKKAAVEDRKKRYRHLFKSNAELDRAIPIKKFGAFDYWYNAPLEEKI